MFTEPFSSQNEFKTFTSPREYGEKVIAKIREFNASLEQVSQHVNIPQCSVLK